jgi:hypothetical protein
MTTDRAATAVIRSYVQVFTPYAPVPGWLDAELSFGARDKRRAGEHRSAAIELASLYGVEYRTPWRLTPNWTVYREMTDGSSFGRLDERRLTVCGPERAVARYLAALPRVLGRLEAAATRAARAFGQWRRSLLATLAGHLDYEDPGTLRVRARQFRTAVLGHLVGYLRTPAEAGGREVARPLWEQAAVAAEVWTARPVDPWDVSEEEVQAVLAGAARYTEPWVIEAEPVESTTAVAEEMPETVADLLAAAGPEQDAPREPTVPGPVRQELAPYRAEFARPVTGPQVTAGPAGPRQTARTVPAGLRIVPRGTACGSIIIRHGPPCRRLLPHRPPTAHTTGPQAGSASVWTPQTRKKARTR